MRVVEGRGIGRKVIDRVYQTYASELAGKRFGYDGEKSLYTVGPLPQNKFEFQVVLDDVAKRYISLPLFHPIFWNWNYFVTKLTLLFLDMW